jgi:hypothetical protein
VVQQTWMELPRYWATSIRSCIIGCWMHHGGRRHASVVHELLPSASRRAAGIGKNEIEGAIALDCRLWRLQFKTRRGLRCRFNICHATAYLE